MSRLFNVFVLACLFWFGIPIMLGLVCHMMAIFGRMM